MGTTPVFETAKDPAAAAAEYGAQFRSDIDAFVSREVVEAAVAPGRHEIPYIRGANPVAFIDPAGGSGQDSMTLCICHREGDKVVVSSAEVEHPLYVRYAWADNPDGANLYNKEGLPASPFRTDQEK